jgi:hypothetical protein
MDTDEYFIEEDLDTYRVVHYIFRTKMNSLNEIILSRFTGVNLRIYDRMKNPKDFTGNIPVPEKKFVELEEAIKDSARFVKEVSKTKNIYLMWSGGIDSTLAFYAMLNENIPFTVLYDDNSIAEYPDLAKKIISGEFPNVKHLAIANIAELAENKDNYFVTGEIGDQCMGSMITMNFNYEQRNMLLKDAIACDLFNRCKVELTGKRESKNAVFQPILLKEQNATKIIVDLVYDTMVELLGTTKENTTVAEFLWYLNFIHKYLTVIYRLHWLNMYGYGKLKNTHHFFNTELFQQYAMSHYKENCAYVKETDYKLPFKEWICRQNGDEKYLESKLKEPSLKVSRYYGGNKE